MGYRRYGSESSFFDLGYPINPGDILVLKHGLIFKILLWIYIGALRKSAYLSTFFFR
jgi:hypothetical protein